MFTSAVEQDMTSWSGHLTSADRSENICHFWRFVALRSGPNAWFISVQNPSLVFGACSGHVQRLEARQAACVRPHLTCVAKLTPNCLS